MAFSLNAATNSVYLYVKTTISYEVDPYSVDGVTVTPATLSLYKGNEADLVAKVTPLTAAAGSIRQRRTGSAPHTTASNCRSR